MGWGRGNHPIARCPAKEVICHIAGGKGHPSNQCYPRWLAEVTGLKAVDYVYLEHTTNKTKLIMDVRIEVE